MGIKYDEGFNAEIARRVKNFNAKRQRLYSKGFRDLPEHLKVRDLKARYTNKRELQKELKLLAKFSKRGTEPVERIYTPGGAVTTEWNLQYLKQNVKSAREYFLDRYKIIASKIENMPGERSKLDTLAHKIQILDLDIKYMNQDQFRSYQATIREYLRSPGLQRGGYRGFLSEVEQIMRLLNYPAKDINKFFNTMKQLTPDEFTRMTEESELISRIYELADSPIYTGGIKINTTDDNAKELIDEMLVQADNLIAEAKKKPVYEPDYIGSILKEAKRTPYLQPELTKENKIKRSSLTPKEVQDLKALGWDDLIDETQ